MGKEPPVAAHIVNARFKYCEFEIFVSVFGKNEIQFMLPNSEHLWLDLGSIDWIQCGPLQEWSYLYNIFAFFG